MKSSRGHLSAPVELEPGLYRAILSLEAGAAGRVEVTAVQAEQRRLPVRLTINVPPGAAVRAAIHLQPTRAIAGDTTTVKITGRIVDGAGNPIAQQVDLTASWGRLEAGRHSPLGVARAVLHLPRYFAGHDAVEIHLHGTGTAVGATVKLPLQPAAAKALRFVATKKRLKASGRAQAIRVEAVDAFGNLVPTQQPPRLQARRGTVGAPRPDRSGSFVAEYVPPRHLAPETDVIEAHGAGLAAATSTVHLVQGGSRVDVGARVGVLVSTHGRLAPSVSVGGTYWITVGRFDLGPRLALTYSHLQQTSRLSSGGASTKATSRQELASAVIGGAARLPLTSALSVHIQAVFGGCWVTSKLAVNGRGYPAEDALSWTARAALGAGLRFGPGEFAVSIGYRWLAAPGLSSAAGTLNAVVASVGYDVAVW